MSSSDRLSALITAGWAAQAVYVMAELRIADFMKAEPRSARDVAEALELDPCAVERLLKALTTLELVRQSETGDFHLMPLGEMLREDAPDSMRAWALWWGHYNWPVWGNLLYSIRTGKSARSMLSGNEGFEMIETDPQAAAVFDRAMLELTRHSARSVVDAFDFSPFGVVLDVGGGAGELLAEILGAHPAARGILFERAHALAMAEDRLRGKDVSLVEGDFFVEIPSGADLIVLKSVIHDWADGDARRILGNCRSALSFDARLLLVERVLPDRFGTTDSDRAAARADLHMLVALGAQERTEVQFRTLLAESGFELVGVRSIAMGLSLLEAVPS